MVAQLTRTRGNKGELCATSLTDDPERFKRLEQVFLNGQAYGLESVWYHKEQPIFKLAGVDSISDAERLVGLDVCIPAADRLKLPEGEFFYSDLVGCEVFDEASGQRAGVVVGWQETGGPTLLEVDRGDGSEALLIPYAAALLKKIDVGAREIRAELPPGLLDLNG